MIGHQIHHIVAQGCVLVQHYARVYAKRRKDLRVASCCALFTSEEHRDVHVAQHRYLVVNLAEFSQAVDTEHQWSLEKLRFEIYRSKRGQIIHMNKRIL